MRNLELQRVRCIPCGETQDASEWGRPCADCGFKIFAVELDRSETTINLDDLFDHEPLGGFLDEETACGSPGPRPQRRDVSRCEEVSAAEIAAFLAATGDARKNLYIGWKRRDLETSLSPEHRICVRCRVPFKAYDNAWNRASLCSKACFQAHVKSTRKE